MSESLRKRVATAAVLIALLLAVLFWLPASATVALLTIVVLMGAWEWSAFLKWTDPRPRAGYVLLIALVLPLAWRATRTPAGLAALLGAALLWWLIALIWIVAAPRRVRPWSAALAGLMSLVPAWLALVHLRLQAADGAEWVLFALVLVWMADIGAYFCGRRFGRRRLAPTVSPGKTWEGAIGGVAASGIVAVAGGVWFGLPLQPFLALCLATVAFSIVGDLTESLLKRFAGMKDSGTLFPGHGGVMDRIDSVTGAAPVLLLGLTFLGVLP
ncbi:MAG TPA: phosphatidate cytidylyltransferase [Steroidobacteraceae bacterium]|nr:phosphatidate cytidylyltransferase [Steroidobacteraceae bacterium]